MESLETRRMLFGPDAFGYRAEAVDFEFEDISATGASVLQSVDDNTFELTAASLNGFQFPFYGTLIDDDIYFSSNGLITFGTPSSNFTNTDFTSSPSTAAIAPLWDDLITFGDADGVYWQVLGQGDSQRLVIQWNEVSYMGGLASDLTFQAVLSERSGSIQFNYLDVDDPGAPAQGSAASATVGIKDFGLQPVGANQLVAAFNNGPNEFVGSMQSTLISVADEELELGEFEQVGPLGGLVYQARTRAQLEAPGDVDEAILSVAGGQTITVTASFPDLVAAAVELIGPDGQVIDSDFGVFGVGPVVIASPGPVAAGDYTVRVADQLGETGVYELGVLINAGLEAEPLGAANDTAGRAEALPLLAVAPGISPAGGGPIRRGAVQGDFNRVATVFTDDFESGGFDPGRWAEVAGATVDGLGLSEPSGENAARFNGFPGGGDSLTTVPIDLSEASGATVAYAYQQTGGGESPDLGDDLIIEYANASGVFVELQRQLGATPDALTFERSTIALPAAALHGGFQLRLSSVGSANVQGEPFDDWFVDDVTIETVGGDEDWYRVELAAGQSLSAVATELEGGVDVTLQVLQDVSLLGDFNDDDAVSAADFTVWRDNLGTQAVLPGDPTPGAVTAEDYRVWRDNFGATRDPLNPTLAEVATSSPSDDGDAVIRDFVAAAGGAYFVRVAGRQGGYQLLVAEGAAVETPVDFGRLGDGPEVPASGVVLGAVDGEGDAFRFAASAGDLLRLETATPSDGPGDLGNRLDPVVEVLDPSGSVVATIDNAAVDGKNVLFTLVAPTTGVYTARLSGADGSMGEVLLSVTGATGDGAPFAVRETIPEPGEVTPAAPFFDLTFTDQIDLRSLAPGDLLIDGVPPESVEVTDGHSLRLVLPPMEDGLRTVSVEAGALVDLQGTPVEAFTGSFVLDSTAPRAVRTSVAPGGIVPIGGLTVAVQFDEPLNPELIDPSDAVLVGARTGARDAGLFAYDPATSTLNLGFVGLEEDVYTLRLFADEFGFVDFAGNVLDGELNGGLPSGDGVAGGDFVLEFSADQTDAPAGPFTRREPFGGLLTVSENRGVIGVPGDLDDFTLFLEAGETIAAAATPNEDAATLSLTAPGLTPVAFAPGPGASAALSFTAPEAGVYTFRVAGDAETTYQLDLFRDAVLELGFGDTSESAPAAIDGSFLSVVPPTDGGDPARGRFAVVGDSDVGFTGDGAVTQLIQNGGFETGDFTGWTQVNAGSGAWEINDGTLDPPSPRGPLPPIEGAFDATITQTGPGFHQLAQSFVAPDNVAFASLSWSDRIESFADFSDPNQEFRVVLLDDAGNVVAEVFSTDPGDPTLQTGPNARSADITAALQPLAGQTVQLAFEEEDNLFFMTVAVDAVELEVQTGQVIPDVDEYELDLLRGGVLDFVLAGHDGVDFSNQVLEVLDASGAVLATAAPDPLGAFATNFDLAVFGFEAPADGTYTLRVTSSVGGAYGLVALDGLALEAEPNDAIGDAAAPLRELAIGETAIGFLADTPPPATAALDTAGFGIYVLPKDGGHSHDHNHDHDHDHGHGVTHDHFGMNAAATAFLPVGVSRAELAEQLKTEPAADAPQAALAAAATSLIIQGETEDNDTLATANPAPLGFDPGEDAAVTISATLTPPALPVLVTPAEDDGAIPLATPTGLTGGGVVFASGVIGDGPFGGSSGDYDWYAVNAVTAGQQITVDIDASVVGSTLDPFIALYDGAGNLLAANDDSGGTLDSFLTFPAPADDDYYVSVFGFGGAFQVDPFITGSGVGLASTGPYDITIGLDSGDTDFFRVELNAGDIFGAGVTGGATRLTFRDASGAELIGSSQDATGIHPSVSPLPGGNAALSWVVDTPGAYYVGVSGGAGDYELDLALFRPFLEQQPLGTQQTLFLDFDGESFNTSIFGGPGQDVTLSPLADFLPGWGLDPVDDLDAVIDAIVASVDENLSQDIRALGINGDFDATGVGGQFDIEILNSRDHADPFGQPNVSRVVVGGSIAEFGISTLGIAQSIDVGNFETEETAVVLLDLLSAPASDPNSLNQFPRDPSASIIDLIGVGVGNITAHEAGHFFGNWHTNQFNTPPSIMDQGGALDNFIGLVGPLWGDGDEIDVDFVDDQFVPNEGFTGVENTAGVIAFGLSSGGFDPGLVGPRVTAVSPPAGEVNDLNVTIIDLTFSEPVTAASTDAANYRLIEAGDNGQFEDGQGDDLVYSVVAQLASDSLGVSVAFTDPRNPIAGNPLPPGSYRFEAFDSGIEDVDGNPLNASGGPGTGSPFLHDFDIVFRPETGGDFFALELQQGEAVTIRADTPQLPGGPPNTLDPRLVVIGPSGLPVASNNDVAGGPNAGVSLIATEAGTHFVQVLAEAGAGEYLLDVEQFAPRGRSNLLGGALNEIDAAFATAGSTNERAAGFVPENRLELAAATDDSLLLLAASAPAEVDGVFESLDFEPGREPEPAEGDRSSEADEAVWTLATAF